ncbi:MAG: hypothetical protein ABGY72_03270 [bacterium]|nr:hypothetical protein [Gemmatimonadota bacterium]
MDSQHCQEGWTLYQIPGPNMKGADVRADFHYYNWVDIYDTLGLGENVPIANGSGSDSLLVLDPQTEEWVVMRVPYPMGFYSRGLDGRIDDPDGGWKGRGVWANYGTNFNWHTEGARARPARWSSSRSDPTRSPDRATSLRSTRRIGIGRGACGD